LHLLPPCEFHASTTELVQLLEQGHYGVALDAEAWDRLVTWIDLGTPAHGTWREIVGEQLVEPQRQRRLAMLAQYSGLADDGEQIITLANRRIQPLLPKPPPRPDHVPPRVDGWPFDGAEAARRQRELGRTVRTITLDEGVRMELVRIPAGEAVLGDGAQGPFRRRTIDRPFWIGRFEVSNAQFAAFDPTHDSRLEHGDFLHFSEEQRGYPLNTPNQPVCPFSWDQAQAFCRWLSQSAGGHFDLPTEDQWEYACRAGTGTPFWFGVDGRSFAGHANLADVSYRKTKPAYQDRHGRPIIVPEWRPAVVEVNDGFRVSAPVGQFQPNPWGLHDMHGNGWEWTRSPYSGRPEGQTTDDRRVVRGGSWSDRPSRGTASARLGYRAWQVVFNVGFRVVCDH
jgi:formylglycine-generating enzyme required for sulfatase activity